MITKLLTPLLVLCLVGCAGASHAPTTPAEQPTSQADARSAPQETVALFDVSIDQDALTASITPHPIRTTGQSELYNLLINGFLQRTHLEAISIGLTADELVLTYEASHPFRAPGNLAGPATAGNRADLAVTARAVWLFDDPDAAIYFPGDGDVRLNSRMVRNPDGYFTPDALLPPIGFSANTFPYQLLADDGDDNRVGVSNGGNTRGNFGAQGWQVAEFEAGITGYDIWAQGQTARNVVRFARSELQGQSIQLLLALIVKYEDPRGGATVDEKLANRLPSGNVTSFSYRMPHGAIDVGALAAQPVVGTFEAGITGSVDVAVHVRDWDARATEAGQTNLKTETNPRLVSLGEAGVPFLDVSIPGITPNATPSDLTVTDDDSAFGGDAAEDSGNAGNELFFRGCATGTPSATVGTFTGLVRARDITDITPPANWDSNRIDLGPDLAPLGTGSERATYLPFQVTVIPAPGMPTYSDMAYWGNTSNELAQDLIVAPTGESYIVGSFQGTVDFDPGAAVQNRTSAGAADSYLLALNPAGDYLWVATWGGASGDVAHTLVRDDAGNLYVSGEWWGTADFDPGAGTQNRTSGNTTWDFYLLALTSTGVYRWIATWGTNVDEYAYDLALTPGGGPALTGTYYGTLDFDPGAGVQNHTSTGVADAFYVSLTSTGALASVEVWGGSFSDDEGRCITFDTAGNVYLGGFFYSTTDLDPGPGLFERTSVGSSDAYVLSLSPAGDFRYGTSWGGANAEKATALAFGGCNSVYVVGTYRETADFDPGPGVENFTSNGGDDLYLALFEPDLAFESVSVWGGPDFESSYDLTLDAAGNACIAGSFGQTVDFDPGVGTATRTSAGGLDGFVLSLSTAGGHRWVTTMGGSAEDTTHGVAFDSAGNPISTGVFWDEADFDPGPGTQLRTGAGASDGFWLKLVR